MCLPKEIESRSSLIVTCPRFAGRWKNGGPGVEDEGYLTLYL
jgi:hypothetical protein